MTCTIVLTPASGISILRHVCRQEDVQHMLYPVYSTLLYHSDDVGSCIVATQTPWWLVVGVQQQQDMLLLYPKRCTVN